MRVDYCPTEEMIADFFTKPLQGALFRKFRAFIMNIPEDDTEERHCNGTDDVGGDPTGSDIHVEAQE